MLKLNGSIAVRSALFATSSLFVGFANGSEFHAETSGGSQEYSACIDEAKAIHPKIVLCVQSEIGRQKKSIEINIDAASKDPSAKELVATITKSNQLWVSYIKKLCDTYIKLGGQRGELLSESCILNEVAHRKLFVENILKEAGI
ncbi:hypothetical protein [Pseudomonas laurylsulfatiphila]|uniref:hypothetical protein n=1 Tax=Pseudomonas laurylsulfatiphila TaxID=2011015 RepID=UPI003D1B5FFC